MAQLSVAEKAAEIIKPITTNLGYDLVDIEYKKTHSGMVLSVIIDFLEPTGKFISINDCETVSKAIDEPLDNLDPTNGASYSLHVSSPGLDRPLKTDSDLARNINNEVEVSLYTKVNEKKLYVGKLNSFLGDSIEIADQNGTVTKLDKKIISKITKHISF